MIELRDIEFSYRPGGEFRLCIPELDIDAGECTAVTGPSGSGKTTLLGLLAGLLKPVRGTLRIGGTDLSGLDEAQRRRFRINRVGQVFQAFELLNYLTVLENVLLTGYLQAAARGQQNRARELLAGVGLEHQAGAYPSELSQGEQQRVAVCRAMLNRPDLLLADEPTGNLDPANKRTVVDLLREQARRSGSTLVMVTHDESLLDAFSSVLDIASLTAPPAQERG
jgi:ABC-type lipoprotein export system ATPase subunit